MRDVNDVCEKKNLYRPQVEQPQYSLLRRFRFERDARPAALEWGMGLVVWSPLGSGLLTGKYDDGVPQGSRLSRHEWLQEGLYAKKNLERVRAFKTYADALGCTRSQLAIAWTIAQPGVSSVITGASRLEQLQDNLGALTVEISDEAMNALDELFPAEEPVDSE